MNWTLVAVLAILIVSTLIGWKKGFIKMLLSLVSMVLVIIITSLIAPGVTKIIKQNTEWDEALESKVEVLLEEKGMLISDDVAVNTDELDLPVAIKDKIGDSAAEYLSKGAEAYNNYVVSLIAGLILSAIVYLVLFIILMICIGIICRLINLVSKLPVIKQANAILGIAAGLLEGLVFVWLFFVILTVFANFDFASKVYDDINRNAFLGFLYDKNALIYVVTKFMG